MQPIDKAPSEIDRPTVTKRRRPMLWIGLGALLVVLVGGVAYAFGNSEASSTTVVRTVAAPSKPPATPACIQGAAATSCNTDEAAEVNIKDKPLDANTRALIATQLVAAREAAMKYPTVADAERAGMIVAGKFSPQTGAHFINIAGAISSTFDPSKPGSYIYDGISPTSKVIGLMYLGNGINPPQGFAGPNDHWHRHSNTCVVFSGGKIVVPFPADSSVTKAQCDAEHGTFMRRTTWMVHAWVVPGWESPLGVFSHENPNVLCKDGTTKADSRGFCAGT
jgi:hypothetical protein